MNVTRIWCKYPGGTEHLINEISSPSRFETVNWPTGDRNSHEIQAELAGLIIEGWRNQGSKPLGTTYRVEHDDKLLINAPSIDETARKAGINLQGWV